MTDNGLPMLLLLYEGQQKSSQADQDTPMKCNQMRFIFQHSPYYGPNTFCLMLQCLDPFDQKSFQE